MRIQSFTKQSTFKILYSRNKEYLIPFTVIGICVIIFFQVILPQIQDTFSLYNQLGESQQRIQTINNNISFASKLDDTATNSELQTVLKALPQEKDFAGILDSVSNAAVTSGVSLGDYTVAVGDLSGGSLSQDVSSNLQISLAITGGVSDVEKFILALKKQLPISNVVEVKIDNGINSQITVAFFYRPFPRIDFVPSQPIEPLSQKDKDLLTQLSTFVTPSF